MGKQLTQQDAQAQEVTVRQQLADVQQSIQTEIANHNATMGPLRAQEQSLEGRLGFLMGQDMEADS